MGEITREQALALAQARRARAEAEAAQPTGAEAMRARGLSSPDPTAANEAALSAMFPTTAVEQFGSGMNEGLAGLLGMPVDLATAGMNAFGAGIETPFGGSEMIKAGLGPFIADAGPNTEAQRRARVAGEYVGPAAVTSATGGLGGLALGTASGLSSGLAAGEVREQGGGPGAEIVASLLAGGVPLAIANKASKVAQTKRAIAAVPEIDDLKARAGALYDKGTATGRTASRGYTGQLQGEIRGIARDNGLILPSGEMMGTYPKVSAALRTVDEYAGQKMAPDQMRQVRRVFQDAAQSADAAEARIGTKMLRKFDDFVAPLVPEFKDADRIYARAMRGKEIDDTIQIAGTRRQGTEMAIGNEFQGLQRKEIRGDLTYPPELSAAVERAGQGGPTRRAAALVGKAAPTGIVSTGLGMGIPAAITAPFLGPVGGMAVGAGVSGTGALSRMLANRLAMGDARMASAVARNGAPLALPQTPEAIRAALIAQLLATGTAAQ